MSVIGTVLLVGSTTFGANDRESGTALLRGVESARREFKEGTFTFSVKYSTDYVDNRFEFQAVLLGDKIGFDGLKSGTRFLYDGTAATTYDGIGSATIDDPTGQSKTPYFFFDPRTLGINSTYRLDRGLEKCLVYQDAKSVTLVGDEEIDGVTTTHVEAVDIYDQKHDYWIDPTSKFHVLKYAFYNGDTVRQVTNSTYDKGAILPNKVVVTWLNTDGTPKNERRVFAVFDAHPNAVVDPNAFTLAAIAPDIPPGSPVADLRIKQRLGYLVGDGDKLANAVPPEIAMGQTAPLDAGEPKSSLIRRFAIFLNLVAIVVLVAWWWSRRVRKKREGISNTF